MRLGALSSVALLCAASATAQETPSSVPIDPAAVSAFAEEFFPRAMAARHIPGLVFVFVSGGATVISRGLGADRLEPYRPVDPARTMVGLASVSKTITATAAMQLVERGQIDLHRDVNGYLKSFQLAADHGPITLHHLLTHTAGFDERLTGVATRSPRELLPDGRRGSRIPVRRSPHRHNPSVHSYDYGGPGDRRVAPGRARLA